MAKQLNGPMGRLAGRVTSQMQKHADKADVSRRQLCASVGMAPGALTAMIATPKQSPRISSVLKICDAVGKNILELLTDTVWREIHIPECASKRCSGMGLLHTPPLSHAHEWAAYGGEPVLPISSAETRSFEAVRLEQPIGHLPAGARLVYRPDYAPEHGSLVIIRRKASRRSELVHWQQHPLEARTKPVELKDIGTSSEFELKRSQFEIIGVVTEIRLQVD